MSPPAVTLRSVIKAHGKGDGVVIALDGISLEARKGEFLCIVGASGCGKSTLLHLVAGLDAPTEGSIAVEGGRPALLFQEHALFPWLTVDRNIDFPLRMAGVDRVERRAKRDGLLRMVGLEGFGGKRPHELSGGMRQRVALARALACRAEVLLMDEPFAALDALMRDFLHGELERIWRAAGLTILFVTHNVREAVRLGDRVLVLSRRPGRIVGEFPVDLPRPRRMDSAEVATRAGTILDLLAREGGLRGDA